MTLELVLFVFWIRRMDLISGCLVVMVGFLSADLIGLAVERNALELGLITRAEAAPLPLSIALYRF